MMRDDRYREIFGNDYEKFKESIGKHQRFSIRVNTIKISPEDLKWLLEGEGIETTPIPWYEEGFFIENPKDIGRVSRLDFHKDGLYFIQNASSMIPPIILDPKPRDTVLDMCAAPGAKTTQLAAMMENKGRIVAAEKVLGRMKALNGNIQRMGATNIETFLGDVKALVEQGRRFNKILLDAPCTGTGSCEPYLLKRAHKGVKSMASIQKKLLRSAMELLTDDGIIVYSTCSLEPEENEAVVDYAVRELGLKTVKIEIESLPSSAPLKSWKGYEFRNSVSNSIRVLPTVTGTEGFFVAKFMK